MAPHPASGQSVLRHAQARADAGDMEAGIDPSLGAAAELMRLLDGYRATCLIVSAVKLGVIEGLRAAPISDAQLAGALQADRSLVKRMLRALAAIGIVEHAPGHDCDRGYDLATLTPMGRLLLDGASDARDRAMLIAEEYLPAWQELGSSVTAGTTAFERVFGMSAWQHRQRSPLLGRSFNRCMEADQLRARGGLTDTYDFSAARLIVDVGGGQATLLAEILARYPQPTGLVFDQAHVVEGAARVLDAAGVAHRCRVVGGSFFDAVPSGGDVYVLQHILHDWDDRHCAAILENCHAAMAGGGTLLVVENTLSEKNDISEHLAMLDLHMMVMLGGRERTRGEYQSMLRAAGFAMTHCIETRDRPSIMVAAPARAEI